MFLCVLIPAASIWYIQPPQKLDMSYSELPLKDIVFSMLMSRRFEVVLGEQEINDLLKKGLSQHTEIKPGVELTGAKFYMQNNQLLADVNVMLWNSWLAGATLQFDLKWEDPNLIAVHTGTRIKELKVPLQWFHLDPLQYTIGDFLPRRLTVKDVTFGGSDIRLSFKLRERQQ